MALWAPGDGGPGSNRSSLKGAGEFPSQQDLFFQPLEGLGEQTQEVVAPASPDTLPAPRPSKQPHQHAYPTSNPSAAP